MDIVQKTIKQFSEAFDELEKGDALENIPFDVKRDTVPLRFQLTARLMPKMLKRILENRCDSVVLPKDIVRTVRAANSIPEETAVILLAIINDHNRMMHDYNKKFADVLFERGQEKYLPAFRSLAQSLSV